MRRRSAYALLLLVLAGVGLWAHASADYAGDYFPVYEAGRAMVERTGDYDQVAQLPSSVLLTAALSVLPYGAAAGGMLVICLLALGLSYLLALNLAGVDLRSRTALALAAMIVIYWPFHYAMWSLNLTIILLAMLLGIAVLLRDRRWLLAGLLFGLSLALKPMLLPVGAIFLAARLYRPLLAAGGLLAALNAVGWLAVADRGAYMDAVRQTASNNETQPTNLSLAQVAEILSVPDAVEYAARGAVVVSTLSIMWLVYRRHGQAVTEPWPFAVMTTAGLLGTFLAFSFAWGYYLVMVLPLTAMLLRRGQLLSVFGAGLLLTSVRLAGDPKTKDLAGYLALERPESLRFAFGMLVLLAGCALLSRSRQADPVPTGSERSPVLSAP